MVDRCLLSSSQLHVSALMAIFRLMNFNKTYISILHMACFFIWRMGGGVIGWGYEISCVLGREGGVYGCVVEN